jgi:hypothetical protein
MPAFGNATRKDMSYRAPQTRKSKENNESRSWGERRKRYARTRSKGRHENREILHGDQNTDTGRSESPTTSSRDNRDNQ